MKSTGVQKVTISLPNDLLKYADHYKDHHGLNRSEVITLALKTLREQELTQGYRAMAQDETALSDPWLDSDVAETLSES